MKLFLCGTVALLLAWSAGAGELQDAAASGDLEKVRALIKASPGSVNARAAGTTALHEATRGGHLEVVKLLMASGANVNVTDISGLTPLKLALGRRQVELADYLRQHGGVEQIKPAARIAPAAPPLAQVPARLFRTNAPASSPSAQPGKTNRPAQAPSVTNQPPSERDMIPVIFPIHEAARVGDVDQIKFLFKHSPDLIDATDQKGLTPLHVATANHQTGVVQTLLALRARVNVRAKTGQTPLHVAARNGEAGIAQLLLTNRALVDVPDNFGNTPLLLALQSSNAETLDEGGGLAAKTSDREGLSMARLHQQQLQLASLLVRQQAGVNARNRAGATPLGEAVRLGNGPVVELLLAAGANPDVAEPATGQSPLHMAAGRGQLAIIQVLLRQRAAVNSPDARGETPLCYALRSGRTNTISVLRAAGGNIGEMRPLDANEQSLVRFYEQTEQALQKAGPAEKARIIIALNPTKADCERMFPKQAALAWKVTDEINRQIKQAFAKSLPDAEQGREVWRVAPEPAGLVVQQWRSQGALAKDLPVYSLAVSKVGLTSRPGDYCFVNGHWVIMPPLRTIAAQAAAAEPARK